MAFLLDAAASGESFSFVDSLASSGVGILIVFIGLVALIVLVSLLGAVCGRLLRDEGTKAPTKATAAPAAPAAAPIIENRDELIVAFSAAVAEELGTDVSAIRVVSFKEIG